ncbi:MAG TPA: purine/pyrimidine permease [Firmicutes bacterium]|nr:purine/pyrimidine permease [Bacillota bacterium]
MLEAEKMVYTLEDIPKPFGKALGLAIQHVLTMFGATVAVPLLLSPALGMDAYQTSIMVSCAMLSAGVATLLQVNFGTRLPIIQGVSFAFLGPFFGIIAATAAAGGGPVSMQYINGAIILGALVEMLIGFSGIIGKLQRVVTPVVIGPVICLIGLALYGSGAPMAGGNWPIAILVMALTFIFALVIGPKRPFFSLFPVLLAVVVGYVVALICSLTGIFSPDNPAFISFEAIKVADWFRYKFIFPWGPPKFSAAFFLVILAGYLGSIIESYGDYHAIAAAAGVGKPTEKMISRGIGFEGVGCFFSGIFGGFASTSYTENIGLVGLTKVASRYVTTLAAIILVILGLFGKFGGLVATLPGPIVGALYCALFGLISAVGLSNTAKADMSSMRNMMIVGFCLFMGLSVPIYIEGAEIVIEGAPWLAEIIKTICSTSMAIAAILGLILDNLIPGTDEERGITAYTTLGDVAESESVSS